jgi:hypothetical protein
MSEACGSATAASSWLRLASAALKFNLAGLIACHARRRSDLPPGIFVFDDPGLAIDGILLGRLIRRQIDDKGFVAVSIQDVNARVEDAGIYERNRAFCC